MIAKQTTTLISNLDSTQKIEVITKINRSLGNGFLENTILILCAILFSCNYIVGQQQVGIDIDSEAADDRSGYSVSVSSDGTRVAIGAPFNDGNGSNAGHIRIYQESGGSWTQIGNDIDGEAADDRFGWSVSLSSDGTRVAIGAILNDGNGNNAGHVRIYQESGGSWTQIGNDIDGEIASDNSGASVSLSSDGTRVAIGAPSNDGNGSNAGHVRIYQESGGSWTQIGNDIDGEAASDNSGWSVSLSSDGTRVVIGAIYNDDNGNNAGHVRIYQESGGSWIQIGNDIDGEAASDQSGWSVSLSSDGTRVAIGAIYNDGNGGTAGHVRIYQESGGSWIQIGNDIDGEAASDQSGWSVSLSSDGTGVAIGATSNDGNGNNAGHVRIYQENGGIWTQIGNDIDGEAAGDSSGYSVSMSSDGTRVAIGAQFNDGNGNNAGHVRVYENLVILPVELIDFEATVQKDHIQLNWTTSNELNNTGFEIQESKTGEDWQSIDFVPANEVLHEFNTYQYKDYNLPIGYNYYRLKQIDFNGRFEYSSVESIFLDNIKPTQVYPNPSTGQFNLTGSNLEGSLIDIIDGTGKIVQSFTYTSSEMDISNLPTGLYLILIDGLSTGERILKK